MQEDVEVFGRAGAEAGVDYPAELVAQGSSRFDLVEARERELRFGVAGPQVVVERALDETREVTELF